MIEKYYLDVLIDGSGRTTYEELAKILKRTLAPETTIEFIDNTGGAPQWYIRLTINTTLSEANAIRQQIRDIPGAWLPTLHRAIPVEL